MASSVNARVLESFRATKARETSLELHAPQKELLDDEALMRLVQRGDLDAFEVLFDRHCHLVLRVGTLLFRNAAEAEDLVQEVFMYLFRKNHVFDCAKGMVKSWLVQVSYSRAFDHIKSRNGHRRGELGSEETYQIEAADPSPNPERLAELDSWRSYFLEAFGSLREEQRKTIELYFYQGYTLQEISQETGYSFPSVRNHVYRGLERLRHRLSEDGIQIRRD